MAARARNRAVPGQSRVVKEPLSERNLRRVDINICRHRLERLGAKSDACEHQSETCCSHRHASACPRRGFPKLHKTGQGHCGEAFAVPGVTSDQTMAIAGQTVVHKWSTIHIRAHCPVLRPTWRYDSGSMNRPPVQYFFRTREARIYRWYPLHIRLEIENIRQSFDSRIRTGAVLSLFKESPTGTVVPIPKTFRNRSPEFGGTLARHSIYNKQFTFFIYKLTFLIYMTKIVSIKY